ncbi:glycosyltransferase [Fibrisoma montanum]|uniref:Glycosyltransferase n=1 Tax=Fibrisoma montanum TaxID=2305895 RepID=A0A418M1U1_9BACT|nr:glycosyltransferase [Fibrisoma montanum]RIV19702.1 glycosyltransferase [Fibrisoma montanum]
MTILLLIISLSYALFTLLLWLTWWRMPYLRPALPAGLGPRITVIIPVRNEAANLPFLLDDLDQQTYRHFNVIVADDSSTDETLAIAREWAQRASYGLHPLPLSDERTASPKKRAITQSIAKADGELIITTDGDCRVGPHWLETFAAFYQETGAAMLIGPVTFATDSSIFGSLQIVEFASLIGSGACTLALGRPTMCNGANLCYQKRVFEQVGGFSGVDHLASGDDEFLMHKVADQFPGRIQFVKNRNAIVTTAAHQSLRAFYQQRKRWASKWRAYTSWLPTLLAVFIFMANAAPVVALGGWLAGEFSAQTGLIVLLSKVIPEFLFLRSVLVFLQKKSSVKLIPLTQLIYPFYVILFGLAAQGKGYRWKGRDLT